LEKPLYLWLARILTLGIILASIGTAVSRLPEILNKLKHEGADWDVVWYLDQNGEAIIGYVSLTARQMGVAIGDKVLNYEEDDTHGELGTPVTLHIQRGISPARDITFLRGPASQVVFGGIQLGLPFDTSVKLAFLFTLIPLVVGIVGALILFFLRSNDLMVLFTAIVLANFGAAAPGEFPPSNPNILIFSRLMLFLTFFWILVFPNGKLMPRWSWAILLLLIPYFVLLSAIDLDLLSLDERRVFLQTFTFELTYIAILALLMILYIRYRDMFSPAERQQTKWVITPVIAGLLITGLIYSASRYTHTWEGITIGYFFNFFMRTVFFVSLAVGIFFSILRYRLWDIDFIINRSLVYGTLTVLLALIFGGSLFLVSRIVEGQNFVMAFGVTALIAGTFFNPTRRRIQRFVDRRFYHIEIDYQKTPPFIATEGMTQVLRQTHFGVYQNLELIGRGGMAEVYKSTHPTLNKPVAIKILPDHLAAEEDFRKRFTREAQIVSKLEHPNIVRMFDSGENNGKHYMVMEYLTGKDLSEFLRANGKMTLSEALPLIKQIASALDYAHQQGLVHRDIKPSNVLLDMTSTNNIRAILTDFGIAKIIQSNTAMTKTGGMLGTFDYMAPEQIQESANVDGRADIYALGVMVYQMLTGDVPFKHNNPGALLIAHLTQPPPDACKVSINLPEKICDAIQRAMAKKPEARFATASEFAAALVS